MRQEMGKASVVGVLVLFYHLGASREGGLAKFAKPQSQGRRPRCNVLLKYSLARNMQKQLDRDPEINFCTTCS